MNRQGNWNVEVFSYRRGDDGAPDGRHLVRLSDTAPFYWGTSSSAISQAELGDHIGLNGRTLITTGDDGGFFLIEARHGFEWGTGSPTSRWRVDDFQLAVDGQLRPADELCSNFVDGLENESGEPLQPLPVPVGLDHSPIGAYDEEGEINDEAYPVCVVSAEYREGPCFLSDDDAFTYLETQVDAEGRYGHVLSLIHI